MRNYLCILFLCFVGSLQAQNWVHHPGGAPNFIFRLYADTVTNKVIAAGAFTMVGNVPVQGIAVWDDTAWTAATMQAFTVSPNFYSVGKYNNDYVFGGTIYDWDQTDPAYVVRWDGSALDSIGHLRIGGANNVLQWGNDLIITTSFGNDIINGVPVSSIARWDGVNWYDLNLGAFNSRVSSAFIYRNQLYAYGSSAADSLPYLHKFTGNSWLTVGQSLNLNIESFCVFNDEIYAGRFTNGNDLLGAVLKLDTLTNTWISPGGGVQRNGYAAVSGMAVMGGKLYVSGLFEFAGGVPVEGVCTWDGTQWCSLGNSLTHPPNTCAALDSTVFFVSNYIFDSVPATGFVEWVGGNYTDSCGFLTTSLPELAAEETLQVAPNPATDHITFRLPETTTGYRVWILNSMGQTLLSSAGRERSFMVEVEDYATGIYFYLVETDEGRLFRGNFCVSEF